MCSYWGPRDVEEKLRRRLNFSTNTQGYNFFDIHGCNKEFMYHWLEYTKRMYKDCYCQIDHLIPMSRFKINNESHVKFFSNWSNLRYLPTNANKQKGASMPLKKDILIQENLCKQFLNKEYYESALYDNKRYEFYRQKMLLFYK